MSRAWRFDKTSDEVFGDCYVRDEHGTAVGAFIEQEDAELCVRAVNCHDELLAALKDGPSMNLPDFLDWLADRLVSVYGENKNVDFVLSCQERAKQAREALAKAEGKE